jgi:phage FluMu protein Com
METTMKKIIQDFFITHEDLDLHAVSDPDFSVDFDLLPIYCRHCNKPKVFLSYQTITQSLQVYCPRCNLIISDIFIGKQMSNKPQHVLKETAINLLEATRAELIAEAKVIAADLCSVRGRVTSTAVLEVMRRGRYADMLSDVDARFMGAVFRSGWKRVGYEPLGSHCRPVSVWERV